MPKPEEVAQIGVAGVLFEDWDTVWVKHRWMEGWPEFRFTCAERAPLVGRWQDLQFKPGDLCIILLGGQLAMLGVILQRQTAYDANTHQVLLSGAGYTWAVSTSSVNTQNGNGSYDKMPIVAVAQKVVSDVGGKLEVIGTCDATPFDRLHCNPGEQVFDFLDRIARHRGARIGSDHLGNVLLIGEHSRPIVQQLIEGQNILKMQCVFSNEQLASIYHLKGQIAGSDDQNMRAAAELFATAKGTLSGVKKYYESVVEQPVKTLTELQMRANYEAIQREGTLITAYVTVQGWLRDGVNLWRTGDNVFVNSPMALLNMVMKIQSATFTQDDNSGTTTTLELVLPWMLGEKWATLHEDGPSFPQPPAAATSDDGPINL